MCTAKERLKKGYLQDFCILHYFSKTALTLRESYAHPGILDQDLRSFVGCFLKPNKLRVVEKWAVSVGQRFFEIAFREKFWEFTNKSG